MRDSLPSGLVGLVLLNASGALTMSTVSSSQFNGTLTLLASSSVTLLLRATAAGVGTQVNQATVTVPAGLIDPTPANNTAQATVTIPVSTNLSISKTNAVVTLKAGSTTSYTITASNKGPAAADGSVLKDPAATELSCTSATCSASGGAVCPGAPLSLAALQSTGVTLAIFPASSSLSFSVVCTVTASGS